ncbi:divalent-cation tolerance protein CutA [Altererythrobacter sp. B11]|uniref:divalent-cation tolerance protein CutA n=1 Tax=Altererythrobacter sp. B11 TaxID=2060312 RepID=UPI000DC6F2A7|nr:divalent-cation tolerance protein CutA [Altererythrobacter sp. B11]BBC71485.1 divalent-cation tolerance protein CutA [Altererythrobacter sp. B11]
MSDAQAALIWCPFPDEESAAVTCGALLDEGLIACANIMPAMRSLALWRGERSDCREAGALLKTSPAMLARTVERLAALHPYEEPAVIGWQADASTPATEAWLAGVTKKTLIGGGS